MRVYYSGFGTTNGRYEQAMGLIIRKDVVLMPKQTKEEKGNPFGHHEIGVRNVRRKTFSVFASEHDLMDKHLR